MSLTLNMVGGGGGGLSATDALLRVQAPAGSTVTINKGTTTKTDLGHENAADISVYDYYFIIHQSQFDSVNPWTVTATLTGEDPVSDTVIIDSADEYDLVLDFTYYLYKNGNQYTSRTGGWRSYPNAVTSSFSAVSAQFESDYIDLSFGTGSNRSCAIDTNSKIDLTGWSKLHIEYTGTYQYGALAVRNGNTGNFDNSYAANANPNTTQLDISNLSGSYYVFLGVWANGQGSTLQLSKVWLE